MTSDAEYVQIPLEDFGLLIKILQSHLHRDTSVRGLLSGLPVHWLCETPSTFVREIPVPPEEQLEIVREWIRDGGL